MISLFFDDLPHSVFVHNVLWEHSHAHLFTYDEGCPGLQGRNWVGLTETSLRPTKRKVFTIWPFREKVCWPLRERIRAWVLIWSFSQPLPTLPISSSFQLLQTPTACPRLFSWKRRAPVWAPFHLTSETSFSPWLGISPFITPNSTPRSCSLYISPDPRRLCWLLPH